MSRIVCGWCAQPTPDQAACAACGHDPSLAWTQRGQQPPQAADDAGRPSLDADAVRELYAGARAALESRGRAVTVEALAEELDRSPRTVRDWRKRFALE